jgi:tetratricopeptide (TPR) repeat protein
MTSTWQGLALLISLLGTIPALGQQESWQTNFNLARKHYDEGRYLDAEKLFARATELAPANSVSSADSWNWLGLARWKLGKYPEAEAAHQKARPLYQKLNGERSAPFAFSTNNLGLVYWYQGRLKEGEELLHQALKILETVEGDKGVNLARGLNNTGGLYRGRGYWKKSEPLLLRSIEIWEFRKHPHGDAAHAYSNLARLRESQKKFPEAVELYEKALGVSRKKLNAQHPQVGEHLCFLGDAQRALGKLVEAEKSFASGMAILDKKLPTEHSARATAKSGLAEVYRAQGKRADAERLFEEAERIWAKQAMQSPGAAETQFRLARLRDEAGKKDQAAQHFQSAVKILETTAGDLSPELATVLETQAKLLQDVGDQSAGKVRERAADIRRRHADENK